MAHVAPPHWRIVLHLDIDAFFCQVEENKHGGQTGRPVAIQQHQDIIAVNYPARAVGVTKHMRPAEARRLLRAAGGQVLHVHLEAGHRVSYGPYRAVSRAMIKLLKGFAAAEVVEKASIDEAFVQLRPVQPGSGAPVDVHAVRDAAAAMRQAVKSELGLTASVGIGRNKLTAKLASGRAKPNGVTEVLEPADIAAMLADLPAARMPGCGGKIGDSFAGAGIKSISDLQAWSRADMQRTLGFPADMAAKLAHWARGEDSAPVAERAPPKTLSVQATAFWRCKALKVVANAVAELYGDTDADPPLRSTPKTQFIEMSLTPEPLAMYRSADGPSVAGDASGKLEPLPVGAANYAQRSRLVLAAMSADLLGRVLIDRDDEGRWPAKLSLLLRFMGGGADNNRYYNSTTSFPAPSLADLPPPVSDAPAGGSETTALANSAPLKAAARTEVDAAPPGQGSTSGGVGDQRRFALLEHAASGRAVGAAPASALEAALLDNARRLCRAASALQPPGAKLVEVRLLATNFSSAAGAAALSIRQFFGKQPAAKRQRASTAPGQVQSASSAKAASETASASPTRLHASAMSNEAFTAAAALPAHRRALQQQMADCGSNTTLPASALMPREDTGAQLPPAAEGATKLSPAPPSLPPEAASAFAELPPAAPSLPLVSASKVYQAAVATAAAADLPEGHVDLGMVDVEEQRRILRQLQSRLGGGGGGGGGPRQRSIKEAFGGQRRCC